MFFISKHTYVHSIKAAQSELNGTRTHHHVTFLNLYIDVHNIISLAAIVHYICSSFVQEFRLQDSGKRPHSQLVWNGYSIHTVYRCV